MANVEFEHINNHQWQDNAECSNHPHEVFFIEMGESARPAKSICSECSVSFDCLLDSLQFGDRYGIFGGYTERERRVVKREWRHFIDEGHTSRAALELALNKLA